MMTKKEYLENQGVLCPYCESNNTQTLMPIEFSTADFAIQDVECLGCGESWTDEYTQRKGFGFGGRAFG